MFGSPKQYRKETQLGTLSDLKILFLLYSIYSNILFNLDLRYLCSHLIQFYLQVFRWMLLCCKLLGQRFFYRRACICLRSMYWCFLCLQIWVWIKGTWKRRKGKDSQGASSKSVMVVKTLWSSIVGLEAALNYSKLNFSRKYTVYHNESRD